MSACNLCRHRTAVAQLSECLVRRQVSGVWLCWVGAGMQSAALGFMLAQAHFADPLVAVPSAVSVVCMVRRRPM